MNTVNLYKWDLNYEQFRDWITETGADVHALTTNSHNITDLEYVFNEEADYLAFTLKFKLRTYRSTIDTGYFYCPYLPLLKYGVFKGEIS
jgi:hypothetical protein